MVDPVTTLSDNDVLCGRGGGTNNQRGNIRFRDLVAAHMIQYRNASRKEKPVITQTVVKIVQARGGRFLKRKGDQFLWFDIGDKAAVMKTSQTFRDLIGSTRTAPIMPVEYTEHQQQIAATNFQISVEAELMRRRMENSMDGGEVVVSPQKKRKVTEDDTNLSSPGGEEVAEAEIVGVINDDDRNERASNSKAVVPNLETVAV